MSEITIKEIMDIIEKDKNFKENHPEYDFIIKDYTTTLGYCDFKITDEMCEFLSNSLLKSNISQDDLLASINISKKKYVAKYMTDYIFDIIREPIEISDFKTMKVRKRVDSSFI